MQQFFKIGLNKTLPSLSRKQNNQLTSPSALYCSSFILRILKVFDLTISYILSWKQMPYLDIRNAKDTNKSSCTFGAYIKVLKIQELPHPTDILKSVL